ncbi:MAG: choice-of-anchor tandem repeat GloVer-containing protein [Candidatus Cybelea sp.]
MVDVNGTLYGTTIAGGSFDNGTVYSITTTGTEKVLYSFGNSPDGARPSGDLIDVSGSLYGTTTAGGNVGCASGAMGCGIVYSVTTAGEEKVLYRFGPGNIGGFNPSGGLIEVNGTLYGTTSGGGSTFSYGFGPGTVYSISLTGHKTKLHNFARGSDGAFPSGAMIDVQGVLYGTTAYGGSSKCAGSGCGTVFALTPKAGH